MIRKIMVEDEERVYELYFESDQITAAFCRTIANNDNKVRKRLKL